MSMVIFSLYCNGDDGSVSPKLNESPQEMTFYVIDVEKYKDATCDYEFTGSPYKTFTGNKIYSGKHCEIFIDKKYEHKATDTFVENVGNKFDNYIYPTVTENFGAASDVDENGKITILLIYLGGDYAGLGGYFDTNQVFIGEESVAKDVYYLNLATLEYYTDSEETQAISILTHEFQHLCNFNVNILNENADQDFQGIITEKGVMAEFKGQMSTFIDEGLAMAAQHMYEGALEDRLLWYSWDMGMQSCYDNNIYYMQNGWPLISWWDGLHDYSLSYMFIQYLRAQAGTDSIYKDIINDTNNNYKAILNVAKKYNIVNNNDNLKELLGNWYIANILQNSEGIYGYKNRISFDNFTLLTGHKSAGIPAGGAIHRELKDKLITNLIDTDGIGYIGIDTSTGAVDMDNSDGIEGNYLIIYNYSGDEKSGIIPVDNVPDNSSSSSMNLTDFDKVEELRKKLWTDKLFNVISIKQFYNFYIGFRALKCFRKMFLLQDW